MPVGYRIVVGNDLEEKNEGDERKPWREEDIFTRNLVGSTCRRS